MAQWPLFYFNDRNICNYLAKILEITFSKSADGYAPARSVNVPFSLSTMTFPGVPVTPNPLPSWVSAATLAIVSGLVRQLVNLDLLSPSFVAISITLDSVNSDTLNASARYA